MNIYIHIYICIHVCMYRYTEAYAIAANLHAQADNMDSLLKIVGSLKL